MSGTIDTLCLRLVDLARAQQAALAAGDLDEALTLMETRQSVCEEIKMLGGAAPRDVVRQILTIDQEIGGAVRAGMKDIVSTLDGAEKVKRYCRDAASRVADGPGYQPA